MEKYYTVEKVAEMLSMHPKTIQRYIREGKLLPQNYKLQYRPQKTQRSYPLHYADHQSLYLSCSF